MTRFTTGRCRAGFSLIELLVVISIVALLAALLIPAMDKSREYTRLVLCETTLHSIGIAHGNYATDNKQYTMHGDDETAYGSSRPATGFDYSFYNTTIFDDDWGDGDATHSPAISNVSTNGLQNICGLGQLMWDYHLEERPEALACPQSDFRENTPGYVGNYDTLKKVKTLFASYPPGTYNVYWRNEYYSGGHSYYYFGTPYVIRGPLMKMETASTKLAIVTDHEQASQSFIGSVPLNKSPLGYGWGRVHKEGFNTLYLDGSVDLYRDFDRSITFWDSYTMYYGNGWSLQYGLYDRK